MRRMVGLVVCVLLLAGPLAFGATPVDQTSVLNAGTHFATPIESATNSADELDEIIWTEDWEGETIDWHAVNGLVQEDHYWMTSDYMPTDGDNWRCYDPGIGTNGGYDNHWLQWLLTPELDLTATSDPVVTFDFRIQCEDPGGEPEGYDGWDGGNVWVFYGDGMMDVIEPATGPAYNVTSFYSFGNEWLMGTGIGGWGGTGFSDWAEVTMDLSDYTDYNNVQVVFAFCSDPAYSTSDADGLTGYQVDNISVDDGDTNLFADDASDPENSEMTMLGGLTASGTVWEIFDGVTGAPSPDHVLGSDTYTWAITHWWETDEFIQLPELQEGESLFLDVMMIGDLASDDALPLGDRPHWTCFVYVEDLDSWEYASNVGGVSGNNYVYTDTPTDWTLFSEGYGTPWDITAAAGSNIKIRVEFFAPSEYENGGNEYTFTYAYFDDFIIDHTSVEHDVATLDWLVPYPVTVNFPVPMTVTFANQGVNPESFNALWYINNTARLFTPNPPYTLNPGESITVSCDWLDDGIDGWIPTTAGDTELLARHLLDGDQVESNDELGWDIVVDEENYYQFGYDDRSWESFINFGDNTNIGPMIHVNPADNHEDLDGFMFNLLVIDYWWYAYNGNEWPDVDVDYDVHVYAGGDTPGAELWSTTHTAVYDPEVGNFVLNSFDVSDVEELQGLTDCWVWVELYTMGTNSRCLPFPLASNPGTHANNQKVYDGTTVSETAYDYFIHVSTMEWQDDVEPEANNGIPTEFALNAAYPNPFNPTTQLTYDVAVDGHVSLVAYNVMGQEVARLVDTNVTAGSYSATFNAEHLSSGVYFIRMESGTFNAVQKIMLLK